MALALVIVMAAFGTVTGSRVVAAEPSVVDPRKPAAIETAQVPVVPPELFAKLAQYQNVRSAVFRGWSPSGDGILITTRFGNSSQLHRVRRPEGRREQLTFFDEPATGSFLPAETANGVGGGPEKGNGNGNGNANGNGNSDGKGRITGGGAAIVDEAILLSMDTGGNENNQLHLFEPRRFRVTRLTDGKSRNNLQTMRSDGRLVAFSSNQRNGRDMDLYIADPRSADPPRLLMPVDRQTWGAADWSPDGKKLLVSRYVSINESYPALLDVESGRREDLPRPSEAAAAFGPFAFAADGRSVFLATDADSEFRRLARVDLATGAYEWLTQDLPWDIDELDVDTRTGDVAFTTNEDGASRLYWLPGGKAPRRDLPLPLGVVAGLEFSPDGKHLGFTLARPEAPADAYSLELASGQLTRWTFSEVGGLDPAGFVRPERIQFPSFDGRVIPAYYYRPANSGTANSAKDGANGAVKAAKAPVLINIHGGPESQYQPLFSGASQFYAKELGFAVLHPNVRGSAGYGKTYLKLDNAERREDSVKDIGALLDWIATREELDASRVAVSGGSYGGYMVLASLTHFPDRIRAGVDVVGICNFLTFLERTASYRVDLRRAEYGDERDPAMKAVFERISPLNNAGRIRSALLVIHGKNDPRVPFFEAEQIAAKVRGNGRTVWTVFAANEGHGMAKKDNADYARAVEALFLRESLR
ncbi:MAG: alpha/beta fold hydrolase [Planctomycetota bacterium]